MGSVISSGIWVGSSSSTTGTQTVKFVAMGSLVGTAFMRVNATQGAVTFIGYVTIAGTLGNLTVQAASGTNLETSTVFLGSGFDLIEVQ